MGDLYIVGVDLARSTFVIHGADNQGYVLFRKKLNRPQFAKFLSQLPKCVVAMEACSSAHH